ncbi:kinase-like domain-containing protein [Mycena crocata]|nr:kinase-like domain-containing protein [Mycena crocata]
MRCVLRGLTSIVSRSKMVSPASYRISRVVSTLANSNVERRSIMPAKVMREDFQKYKSGAWLFNDTLQRNNRFIQFDAAALVAAAIQAGGATSCTSFEFLADGTSNRLFDIRLDNGLELVAKLPFVIAGPAHFTTASEVATMMFAQEVLQLPVPRLYTWCSRAEESKVGWEYIIMEKVSGVQLYDRWNDIRGEGVAAVIEDLVDIEEKMTNTQFGMVGSLYLAEDLPENTGSTVLRFSTSSDKTMPRQYKIGPSVDRRFWRGARAQLKIDRGPWTSVAAYARAIANCEIAWLQANARPHAPASPLYRSATENDPQTHLALLRDYSSVIDHLIPPKHLRALTLWHPDFHASNIIVTSLPAEIPRIEAVLDWQTARIEPLLHAGSAPGFVDDTQGRYVSSPAPGQRPQLPANFDTLDDSAKRLAEAELRQAFRHILYNMTVREKNTPIEEYRAFELKEFYTWPHYWASRTWDEGTAILETILIKVCDEWEEIAGSGTPCPISFSEERRASNAEAMRRFMQEGEINALSEEIGIQPDGWVSVDKLDEAVGRNREVRERCIAGLEEHDKERVRQCWPFQDGALSLTAEPCR